MTAQPMHYESFKFVTLVCVHKWPLIMIKLTLHVTTILARTSHFCTQNEIKLWSSSQMLSKKYKMVYTLGLMGSVRAIKHCKTSKTYLWLPTIFFKNIYLYIIFYLSLSLLPWIGNMCCRRSRGDYVQCPRILQCKLRGFCWQTPRILLQNLRTLYKNERRCKVRGDCLQNPRRLQYPRDLQQHPPLSMYTKWQPWVMGNPNPNQGLYSLNLNTGSEKSCVLGTP